MLTGTRFSRFLMTHFNLAIPGFQDFSALKNCTSCPVYDIIDNVEGFFNHGNNMRTYYPTPKDANIVQMWTRAGIGPERICKRLGVTMNQLENSFPFELGYTEEESLAVVADVAYQMAVSGSYPTMTRFWLESRGGWSNEAKKLTGTPQTPFQVLIDSSVVEGEFTEVVSNEVVEVSVA